MFKQYFRPLNGDWKFMIKTFIFIFVCGTLLVGAYRIIETSFLNAQGNILYSILIGVVGGLVLAFLLTIFIHKSFGFSLIFILILDFVLGVIFLLLLAPKMNEMGSEFGLTMYFIGIFLIIAVVAYCISFFILRPIFNKLYGESL